MGRGLAARERWQAARKGCREPAGVEVRLLRCQLVLHHGKRLLPSFLCQAPAACP